MEHTPQPKKRANKIPTKAIATGAIVLVTASASFMAGVQYQKGHTTTTSANTQGQMAMNGPQSFGGSPHMVMRGAYGTVTAISSASISVDVTGPSGTKTGVSTFTITADTTITNNGATASVSDIKTGDTVMVTKTSQESTTAQHISLNPSMGSNGSGTTDTQSSDSSLDTSTN